MKNIEIVLHGCDDSTKMEITVSQEELKFLKMIANLSKLKSTYSCQQTLSIQ